ncbi:MAG: MazG nucleotide pyrophosphohydrolase [Berkelbacteria bacterium GW2011_GWB1_38_5]|uniref:MazG nucleotide pyrophosphohydrolase n=2 Tax=Candidatus Berkelbacteria TaxID=1618330 RepID=A0A0G0FIH7_9BACT|nr:MAG: MazG nucleotide pyrophosphohydrolase [Berkelbacteria bacterium GW2011_GWA1_36_9]KKQ72895.1 MAG: MazG nucleotide pyrophosphohydrolase [Berkelbacteria bacterium GW2011_GWB1_38_5]
MKIVIGSSMKFRSLVKETLKKLKTIGVDAEFPNIDYSHKSSDEANTIEEKKRLALEHYESIKNADAIYFIMPDGYMGTSCKIELGYALALGKLIYFSEPTNDLALDCYVKKFIPLDKLILFKE